MDLHEQTQINQKLAHEVHACMKQIK